VEHIAKPLRNFMVAQGLADGVAGWRAVELWPEVVGEEIAGRTNASRFSDGTLIVEVTHPTWMHELSFMRKEIVGKLNAALERDAVTGIHFVLSGGGRRRYGKR